MSRERQLYRETYRKGAVRLRAECLPVLKHEAENGRVFKAVECEVLAAGQVQRGDQVLEYQDIRVYVEVT